MRGGIKQLGLINQTVINSHPSITMTTQQQQARSYLGLNHDQINELQGLKRQQALAIWRWASIRFSSHGTDQARYFKRYGAAATYQRVNRVRQWLGLEAI